jgi:hypothetical protein
MGMLAMLGMLANTSDLQFERVWLLLIGSPQKGNMQ